MKPKPLAAATLLAGRLAAAAHAQARFVQSRSDAPGQTGGSCATSRVPAPGAGAPGP